MSTTWTWLREDFERLLRCERGATAIEYALVAGGIALAIIVVVSEVGDSVEESFEAVRDGFN